MINGVTKIVMTKADVLDSFKKLQVCTAYNINGRETQEIPFRIDRENPEPVYREFSGWNSSTGAANSFATLPDSMKTYVSFINEYLGVGVQYISNGPGREQIICI